MKTLILLVLSLVAATAGLRADGRPGSVQFSDGRTLSGALSLTPGKNLRIYTTDTTAVSLALGEVKELRFKVEKEEMRRGFYFPNAGQATQAQTDDIYPVRYLTVEAVLPDGSAVAGHLMTTTLYVDGGENTRKVVLMAKMTGENGQKISDVVYPATIRFDAAAQDSASLQIDLTNCGIPSPHAPVVFGLPDLSPLPVTQIAGKSIWRIAAPQTEKMVFVVEAADGIHVACPQDSATAPDAAIGPVIEHALADMHDFFDTRTALNNLVRDDDVFSLVMLSRTGATHDFDAEKVPWSLVAMRWKYDPDAKKAVLLNRANLAVGRAGGNSAMPSVFKQPELLRNISSSTKP